MTSKSLMTTLLKNCSEETLVDKFSKKQFDCDIKEIIVKTKVSKGIKIFHDIKSYKNCHLKITKTTCLVEGITLEGPKLRVYINDKFIGWIKTLDATFWNSGKLNIVLSEEKFSITVIK